MANNALAEAVGIAPSTCLARVRLLRESGVDVPEDLLQSLHQYRVLVTP